MAIHYAWLSRNCLASLALASAVIAYALSKAIEGMCAASFCILVLSIQADGG